MSPLTEFVYFPIWGPGPRGLAFNFGNHKRRPDRLLDRGAMRLSVLASIALFAALIPCGGQAQSDLPPPLPERNPLRPGAPVPPKPLAPAEFQTEPWTAAEVTAATDACKTLLASVTLDYEQLAPIKEGVCGAPAPILLRSVGNDPKVEINPPATISCPLAKALSVWLSKIVQPEAKALLGSEVVGLHNATSYACRNRNGGAETPLSEHALANALDVSEFKLASGDSITVLKGWPRAVPPPPAPLPNPVRDETVARSASPEAEAVEPARALPSAITPAKAEPADPPSPPPVALEPTPDPKSAFLKLVHDRACQEFGTVLGPDANDAHKDHFHLDQKQRRSGFCQ